MTKLKYFKNITKNSADFYVYGELVDEKEPDFWTGEISNTAVDPQDMKDELDELQRSGVRDLNIYINSPGGSVFASSTIVSMLKRARQSAGLKIHAYIDGLCASAATYLAMVADDVNVYKNSIMMIHKPMCLSIGNADDLQKDINTLNTIENDVMLPMYMDKAKDGVTSKQISEMTAAETWFNGNPEDKLFIGNFFNINFLDQAKAITACASPRMFKNYQHVPEDAKTYVIEDEEKPVENPGAAEESSETEEVSNNTDGQEDAGKSVDNTVDKPVENLDYSEFENIIKNIKH